jgi:hypothetical protein
MATEEADASSIIAVWATVEGDGVGDLGPQVDDTTGSRSTTPISAR